MTISAQEVKKLRDMTGAGMMDCKEALVAGEGDVDKAVEILRKRGQAKAAKKVGRETNEGLVHSYIHAEGRIGVLIQVNCETDFVARTDEFKSFVNDLAMQVAAASPRWVKPEDVDAAEIEKEREIYRQQMLDQGKPEQVVDKIVDGKIGKFYEEYCLLEQPFIKDQDKRIKEVVSDAIAKLGENVQVTRFSRFQLGE